MAIVYPKGAQLTKIFLDGFDHTSEPEIIMDGNPLCIRFADIVYNIYLKCISWKGKPYPENDTRAQLPSRPEFEHFKSSDDRFLFLGYDPICDVLVCWNPTMVKARLNRSSYVSFYSKRNLQEEVQDGKTVTAHLSNGDKYVLFKRNDIAAFLSMIEVHFPSLKQGNPETVSETPSSKITTKGVSVVGILDAIENDKSVENFVDHLFPNHTVLEIVAKCFNQFGDKYHNMRFQNWGSLISSYLNNHGEKS